MLNGNHITIFTIGHSTRSLDEFIELLRAYGITMLIDIRTIPKSRQNPQFNLTTLELELPKSDIKYRHMKGLGGLRHPKKESINSAWENASFRGFADYMQTVEFSNELVKLIAMAQDEQVAMMCAEENPFRCHRILIADALIVHGIEVRHISSSTAATPHHLTPFARVEGKQITYPNIP